MELNDEEIFDYFGISIIKNNIDIGHYKNVYNSNV